MGVQHRTSQSLATPPPQMDPKIWSHMPDHLLDHVLSFLPLKTFFNLRSTCKHFKSLIFSPSFISKHSSCSPLSSYILFSHPQFHHLYPLFDTTLNTWCKTSLSLSSPMLTCSPSSKAVLLSVSHGFLCFSLPNSSTFLVYNILSRSSKTLHFPTFPFAFELLTLVSSPNGSFKLFMICSSSSGPSSNTFVYDSVINLWSQFDSVDSVIGDNHQEAVSCDGILYFTTPEPFSILCFDLENGKWERPAIEMPGELTFARLVSDGVEKMFLVGGIGEDGISRGMKVWELSGDGGNWVEIGSVPGMICRKFMSVCYHNYEQVYCFWHQGLICVCCYNWPEILYYKVSRRTWHWLPKCPSVTDKWRCGFRWFSLVPELYPSV
ncbi:unnamed protein product [Camellia sinensis]